MKIKKLALLLLVLVFSMTACSSGQESVDFNYTDIEVLNTSLGLVYNMLNIDEATKAVVNNSEGQEVYQTAISNFENAEKECGEFVGFITAKGSTISLEEIVSQVNETGDMNSILMDLSTEIVEEGPAVRATMQVQYEEREAEISFVYVSDKANTNVDESGAIKVPFQLSEATISPDYSFGEKMTKAAMNTLMGMGSVFIILIFIALIIGQFERLSKAIVVVSDACSNLIASLKSGNKKIEEPKKVEEVAPTPRVVVPTSSSDDLMNDSQLVAVITAALMAAQAEAGNPGSDGLIVRSIRKAKR